MKLRMLKPRTDEDDGRVVPPRRSALRVIEGPTQIIEWPFAVEARPTPADDQGIVVTAEVQTKRFRDRGVDAERYCATVRAQDDSPYAIMAALVNACAGIEDFRRTGSPDDRLILQISLRS
jgi:hypothetical protein